MLAPSSLHSCKWLGTTDWPEFNDFSVRRLTSEVAHLEVNLYTVFEDAELGVILYIRATVLDVASN